MVGRYLGGSLFFIVVGMIVRNDNFGFNFERSKQAVLVVAFGFRLLGWNSSTRSEDKSKLSSPD